MKLQFKYQSFQREAACAVVDAFLGQPLQNAFAYRMDVGKGSLALEAQGFRNQELQLSDTQLPEYPSHPDEAGAAACRARAT